MIPVQFQIPQTCSRIPVSKVRILWSEGESYYWKPMPVEFDSLTDSLELTCLLGACNPNDGGYLKSGYEVEFADGFVFNSRIDITIDECSIAVSMRRMIEFATGDHRPPWMSEETHGVAIGRLTPKMRRECKRILDTYEF